MRIKQKILLWWYTYPNSQMIKALLFWIVLSGIIYGLIKIL